LVGQLAQRVTRNVPHDYRILLAVDWQTETGQCEVNNASYSAVL